MKMIALIIILLSIVIIYVDYKKYSTNTQKEVIKDYPYVKDTLLYTEGFVVALEHITKVILIDNGGVPYYFIEYRVNENKRGGMSMSVDEFRKIERYLIK